MFGILFSFTLSRNDYYRILEQTQKGSLEVTMWIQWFLETLLNSLKESSGLVDKIVTKAMTWQKLNKIALDNNQKKIITMMLDGFEGNLTSSKLAKICKCSQDTAIRSINYLVENKVLEQKGAGRSTHYILACMEKIDSEIPEK